MGVPSRSRRRGCSVVHPPVLKARRVKVAHRAPCITRGLRKRYGRHPATCRSIADVPILSSEDKNKSTAAKLCHSKSSKHQMIAEQEVGTGRI